MDNPAEKKIPEETIKGMKIKTPEESEKVEKTELTDEEAEKVAGGASFGFYDRGKRGDK